MTFGLVILSEWEIGFSNKWFDKISAGEKLSIFVSDMSPAWRFSSVESTVVSKEVRIRKGGVLIYTRERTGWDEWALPYLFSRLPGILKERMMNHIFKNKHVCNSTLHHSVSPNFFLRRDKFLNVLRLSRRTWLKDWVLCEY